MDVMNALVNLLYGTNKAVRQFQTLHPNETVIAASAAKGVRSTPKTEVDTGAHWVVARRAVAILTDQRIQFGDWNIPVTEIKHIERIPLRGLISKGQLINVATHDGIGYQFGMQHNKDWLKATTLSIETVNKKIKTSTYSWIMRGILLLFVLYWIYNRFLV